MADSPDPGPDGDLEDGLFAVAEPGPPAGAAAPSAERRRPARRPARVFQARPAAAELARVIARHPLTLLVGAPGAGKTSLLGFLARAAFEQRRLDESFPLPPPLRGRRFHRTSVIELQAGCAWVNQLEGRVTEVAARVINGGGSDPGSGVLWIEDVHVAGTAGATLSDPSGTVANILLPLIAAGLRVVGTTTPAGLELLSSSAPEFVHRARIIRLATASEDETQELLRRAAQAERRHWDDAAIGDAVALAGRVLRGRALPGSAFELMREADRGCDRATGPADVAAAASALSGLVPALVDPRIPLAQGEVERTLAAEVVEQPDAVAAVARAVAALKAGLAAPGRPLRTFLFLGPTGVGKTALARALARFVFGAEEALVRRDMSEFAGFEAAERLLGLGRDGRGLADAVAARPFSVVLLDEAEKCSRPVQHLLLQLLGEGRLGSPRGSTADFSSAIVVLTSNAGAERWDRAPTGFGTAAPVRPSRARLKRMLADHFPTELLNRIDDLVLFAPLSPAAVATIARREVETIRRSSELSRRRIELELARATWARLVAEGYDPADGARPMIRAVQRLVADPVAQALAADPGLHAARLVVHPDGSVARRPPRRGNRHSRRPGTRA